MGSAAVRRWPTATCSALPAPRSAIWDGDGVSDLAVGARWDDSGGNNRGAVHVLFMNSDGTVKSSQKIGDGVGGGPPLANSDYFGEAVSLLGDLDGDGASDLAVGARGVDTSGNERGAAYVLFLTPTVATATVTSTVFNAGQVNRSGLASLMLQFNEAVTVSGPEALQMWNHTTGTAVSISGATLVGNGSNAITWDLSGVTLPDGYYTATLPKAEGLAATHSTLFHVLAGDSGGDAQVGFGDFGDLAFAFNTLAGPVYGPGDMNGDGNVNFADFGILAGGFNNSLALPVMDFGDAGGSFPTSLPNGARHILGSGLSLGVSVDDELDGQPDPNAAGDGADEDGVTFGTLQAGNSAAAITVNAAVPATAALNAWVDFNSDGDWGDAGEQIFVDQTLSGGNNNLTAAIPAGAVAGATTARFRLSSVAGYGVAGLAVDGEVEDYRVTIVAAASSSLGRQVPAALSDFWVQIVAAGAGRADKSSTVLSSAAPTQMEVVDLAIEQVAGSAASSSRPQVADHKSVADEDLNDQLFEGLELLLQQDT